MTFQTFIWSIQKIVLQPLSFLSFHLSTFPSSAFQRLNAPPSAFLFQLHVFKRKSIIKKQIESMPVTASAPLVI